MAMARSALPVRSWEDILAERGTPYMTQGFHRQ
ncbi:MAG: hypothetical protein JWO67_7218 [Streptosporangiaceae bacterium]|nr:hypothetical protein [Streptosporangiaceae bacterium]